MEADLRFVGETFYFIVALQLSVGPQANLVHPCFSWWSRRASTMMEYYIRDMWRLVQYSNCRYSSFNSRAANYKEYPAEFVAIIS